MAVIISNEKCDQILFNVFQSFLSVDDLIKIRLVCTKLKKLAEQVIVYQLKLSDNCIPLYLRNILILCYRSEYFKKLFFTHFKETTQKEVILPDLSPSHFQNLILHDPLQIDENNLAEALEIASYYRIFSLEEKCAQFLKQAVSDEEITFESLKNIFHLAKETLSLISQQCEVYFSKKLKQAIVDRDIARTQAIAKLPIQDLDLSECEQLTDKELVYFKEMPLRKLSLRQCKNLTGKGFVYFKGMPLEKLMLSMCKKLTNAALVPLKEITTLKTLVLAGCTNLTNKGFMHLEGMSSLLILNLKSCNLTDKALGYLKGKKLQVLILSRCKNLTDEGFANLKGMPLRKLRLSRCKQLTDKGMEYFKEMPLQVLDLSWCKKLTDAGLAPLKGKSLEILDLAHMKLTDKGFEYFGEMPLRKLNLKSNKNLSGKGLESLKGILTLHKLKLSRCKKLKGEGLENLIGMPLLKTLDLRDCRKLTNMKVAFLTKEIPSLKKLKI